MESRYSKFVFAAFVVLVVYISFLIIKPLIVILLWSFLLSYLFYPIFKFLRVIVRFPSLASLLTIGVMILTFTLPLVFIVKEVSSEVAGLFSSGTVQFDPEKITIEELVAACEGQSHLFCTLISSTDLVTVSDLSQQAINKVLVVSFNFLAGLALNIPSLLFQIALSFFLAFFLLRDGKQIIHKTFYYIPMDSSDVKEIVTQVDKVTKSILFASLLVAFIQGMLGSLGLWYINFPQPILLGLIMGFFALIPLVGTVIVWLPIAVYLAVQGFLHADHLMMYQGIGFFLYGAFVIGTIDNFLRPKFIGDSTKIHTVIIIIGVIGGTALFGFIGLFMGPIILALLLTLIKLSKEKFHMKNLEKDTA